jgi:hypothetical protein
MTRAKCKFKAGRFTRLMLWIKCFPDLPPGTHIRYTFISVDYWSWLSLLALAYPFILFINGVFALGWIFFRNWFALFSIVAIICRIPLHKKLSKSYTLPSNKIKCEEINPDPFIQHERSFHDPC